MEEPITYKSIVCELEQESQDIVSDKQEREELSKRIQTLDSKIANSINRVITLRKRLNDLIDSQIKVAPRELGKNEH